MYATLFSAPSPVCCTLSHRISATEQSWAQAATLVAASFSRLGSCSEWTISSKRFNIKSRLDYRVQYHWLARSCSLQGIRTSAYYPALPQLFRPRALGQELSNCGRRVIEALFDERGHRQEW